MTDDVKALVEALKPFAEDANRWADSVPDTHRSRCFEPGAKTAHPGSETVFSVGDLRRARAALEALSRDRDRAGEQKVVVVKPLDWNEYEREGAIEEWDAEAGSFGCFYNIRLDHYGYRLTFDHGQFGTFDNLDTAKSAAQADYEKLILSALASPRS